MDFLSTQQINELSIGERIREAFAECGGGLSTKAFAQYCLDNDVWTEDELAGFTLKAAQAAVRKELKVMDKTGLPFAGVTATHDSEGNPVWEQRHFWDPETYVVNIRDLRTRAETLTGTASKLQDEGEERFGRLPFESADEVFA